LLDSLLQESLPVTPATYLSKLKASLISEKH